MALIAGSNYTIAAGVAGAWFTATGSSFVADVDSAHMVRLETRRDVSDTAIKVVASERSGADVSPKIVGPCSVIIASVTGRQYRFVAITGPAVVAADA
ncbi:MAG: hypothetical protein Q7T78_17035 [Rhodoferax sp.]|nr:hypothetical protein [Rhodoferax sp.]